MSKWVLENGGMPVSEGAGGLRECNDWIMFMSHVHVHVQVAS